MRRKGSIPGKVRVRRERPSGAARAAALAITMLMVYLITVMPREWKKTEDAFASPRITREISFEPLEMYIVSLYSCASPEEARILASGYAGKGAAGYVHEHEGAWQVLGAVYEEERDAARIAQRLSKDENLDAQVICVTASGVDMRVTAPEIQINAIAEADGLLRGQSVQLGTLALQLDRNEISPGAACTLCAVAATRARAAEEVLERLPGSEENKLCRGLIERLGVLSRLLDAAAGSEKAGNTALSGMLRCAQIDTFLGQAALQEALVNTQ
ncbi:MAG: hypothetical protein IKM02_04495 [Clostridia bacterium]|nr:hypothetical protein [Clostridia bacterium]